LNIWRNHKTQKPAEAHISAGFRVLCRIALLSRQAYASLFNERKIFGKTIKKYLAISAAMSYNKSATVWQISAMPT
jgi:hypothetical protein